MNPPSRWSTLAAVALLRCGVAIAAHPQFGELPDGSLGTAETQGVSAEICREHVFDPDAAPAPLPQGYRLRLVSEIAGRRPALQALLEAHPRVRNHALGLLCFVAADSVVLQGAPDPIISPAPTAFWWALADGPRHPDMRGKATWVQLGSWYPSATANRSAVRQADPMAQFVDLAVQPSGPNRWRLRLAIADEVVTADVQTADLRTPSTAPQPGFMSVPLSGRSAAYFIVFTYAGHVHRAAQGTWRATGTGVFSDALAVDGEGAAFETVFQEGWVSKSGVYSFAPR